MSKCHGVSTENSSIFFFFNATKIDNVPEFKFEIFYKTIFARLYTWNIYRVTAGASWVYTTLCEVQIWTKKEVFEQQEFHIWQRHLTIQVKHSYIIKSDCVLYHRKLIFPPKKLYFIFQHNLQQSSSVNRTLFKNEIKGITNGAPSISI